MNLVASGENYLPDSSLSLIKRKCREKGLETGVEEKDADTGMVDKCADTGVVDNGADAGVEEKGANSGVEEKCADAVVKEKGANTAVEEKGGLDTVIEGVGPDVEEKCLDTDVGPEIKWRVLNWKLVVSDENKQLSNEYRQVLSKAVSIFHVSIFVFLPHVTFLVIWILNFYHQIYYMFCLIAFFKELECFFSRSGLIL